MPEEDPLTAARERREEAAQAASDAEDNLRQASIRAKQHLMASDKSLKSISAEINVSRPVLSGLAPSRKTGEWKPNAPEIYQAVDAYTRRAYNLAALRKRYDLALETLGRANADLDRIEARTDVGRTERPPHVGPDRFPLPDLPPNFVPRLAKRAEVVRGLIDLRSRGATALGITSAADLHGTGGFGKTTLALDVARQREVRTAFPDGIAFIEIGQQPSVATLLSDWAALLDPAVGSSRFGSLDAAAAAFTRALGDQRVLLILDNVWKAEDVEPFLRGGPHCVRLVTSRRSDLLPTGVTGVDVDRMEPAEAMELLLADVPGATSDDVFPLYERSSRWPVVLGLLNGVLRGRVAGNVPQSLTEVVAALTHRLQQHGVFAADDLAKDDERTASAVLELSIDELATRRSAIARERFVSLAAFPSSSLIDFVVLGQLWGCDQLVVATTCDDFANRSLLETRDATGVRLHDVVHEHLLRSRLPEVRRTNTDLVGLFRTRCPEGRWDLIGRPDEHFLNHLSYHLINCGLEDELDALLRDLRFLGRRILQGGPAQLMDDLTTADTAFARNPYRLRFEQLLQFTGQLLVRGKDIHSVAATLHSRAVGAGLADWLTEEAEILRNGLVATRPLPDERDTRLLAIAVGHTEAVKSFSWRTDGDRFASGSADRTVRLWTRSGNPVGTFTTENEVFAVAWSPDRLLIAALSTPNVVSLIEPIHGEVSTSTPPAGELNCLAWSPDSRLLALGTDGRILVWDPWRRVLDTELGLPKLGKIRAVAWHTTGQLAALAGDELFIWSDLESSAAARHIELNMPRLLSWSPDGSAIAVAGADGHVILIDAAGTARSDSIDGWVTTVDWRADGDVLAVGSDQGAIVLWGPPETGSVDLVPSSAERENWDRRFGRQAGIDLGRHRVSALAWQPGGTQLAVGAHNKDIRLYDPSLLYEPNLQNQMNCVAWHPRLPLVAAGSYEGELLLVSTTEPNTRWTFPAHPADLRGTAFSPDGRLLVTVADDGVAFWQLAEGPDLQPLTTNVRVDRPSAVCWAPSGELVAIGGHNEVALVDPVNYAVIRRVTTNGLVNSVDLDPSGALLAVGTASSTLTVHNIETGDVHELEGHTSTLGAVRWAGFDTSLISGGFDGRALRWTFDGNRFLPAELGDHEGAVWGLAVDPETKRVITVCTPGSLGLFDLAAEKPVHTLVVDSAIGCVDIAPDGVGVVAGGAAGLYFFELR
ncbi:NB-ARC domain-containing protein [Amycolatopsis minnesotensis]|uniref:WD40 repeat protein n=1 Tax=Amycolatopsis minnesotensis TaxID=337894 RepID=A0ABN2PXZ5_9PSEU